MPIVTERKQVSPHFHTDEFLCRCGCGEIKVSTKMVALLEKIRYELGGKPVHVNSGYRCPEYNDKVGGAKYSRHKEGDAADITVKGHAPHKVYETADTLNQKGGVGQYNSFTHVDTRGYKARW